MTAVRELAANLSQLNAYLAPRSYITGYAPTSDDAVCFEVVGSAPDQKTFLNVARWFKHISAFTKAERDTWPAGAGKVTVTVTKQTAKSPAKEAPKKEAPKKAVEEEEEEEEEDDLFASDEEADRAHEEALKAKVAAARVGKPQNEKPKQRSLIVFEIKPNDIETDLQDMAIKIKQIEHKGIQNWGAEHKLIPVAFGIKKLAISAVVWDDDIDTEMIGKHLFYRLINTNAIYRGYYHGNVSR